MAGPSNVDGILREFEAMNGSVSNVTSTANSESGDVSLMNEILMADGVIVGTAGPGGKKKLVRKPAVVPNAKRGISINLP